MNLNCFREVFLETLRALRLFESFLDAFLDAFFSLFLFDWVLAPPRRV